MKTQKSKLITAIIPITLYYAEQKSIDEVIPIIENRVNNMLEERS